MGSAHWPNGFPVQAQEFPATPASLSSCSRFSHPFPRGTKRSRPGQSRAMEMGCVWTRRVSFGGALSALPVKPSYSILSTSLLSFLHLKSPRLSSAGFSPPSRLPLSTAACSSSAAVVPDDEDSFSSSE